MINLNALTEDERKKHDEYLKMAQAVRSTPSMADSRNTNIGEKADPTRLLPKLAAPGSYSEKIDAIFDSK